MWWQSVVCVDINKSIWWMSPCIITERSLWSTDVNIPCWWMSLCSTNYRVSSISLWSILILSWWKFLNYVFVFLFLFLWLMSLFLYFSLLISVSHCFIVFCDMASPTVPIWLKCSCWFSKQSGQNFQACCLWSASFGLLLPGLICWYWGSLYLSLCPGDYASSLAHSYFIAPAHEVMLCSAVIFCSGFLETASCESACVFHILICLVMRLLAFCPWQHVMLLALKALCCLFYVISVIMISDYIYTRVHSYTIVIYTDGMIITMCLCLWFVAICVVHYWLGVCCYW